MPIKNTGKNALKQRRGSMNYPAASSGVSKRNMFTPDAASGGELNPKRLMEEMKPHERQGTIINICTNASCRLRKAGYRGFEGCPGYKGK